MTRTGPKGEITISLCEEFLFKLTLRLVCQPQVSGLQCRIDEYFFCSLVPRINPKSQFDHKLQRKRVVEAIMSVIWLVFVYTQQNSQVVWRFPHAKSSRLLLQIVVVVLLSQGQNPDSLTSSSRRARPLDESVGTGASCFTIQKTETREK